MASFALSRSASKSPIPSNLPTKPFGLNSSKSSGFSPTPMNLTGAFVTEHADNAPPPFAVPSSFVITTPVTPHVSWNFCACDSAAWPISADNTNKFSLAFNFSFIFLSSSTSSSLRASLPAVSIRTISYFEKCFSCFSIILTGSFSFLSPNIGTLIILDICSSWSYAAGRQVSVWTTATFCPLF